MNWLNRLSRALSDLTGRRLIITKKAYALPEQLHLRRLLGHFEVDCVFDVGANAGQYATMLREKVGYAGRIVSFEPTPELVTALQQKSARDPLWSIEAMGLGATTGTQTFNIQGDSQFNSFSRPLHTETDRFMDVNQVQSTVEVRIETLADAYARLHEAYGFARPFLKMDTQGYDVAIVGDQREVLQGFVGLQSELSVKRIYEGSVEFREAIELYRNLGFELSALVPNNAGHFPLLVEVDGIFVRRDLCPAFKTQS